MGWCALLFINVKLGRNAPCWCGSGRKYKKCHLNREFEKPVPFEAIAEAMQSAAAQKWCLHPLAGPGVCDKVISAHTIQRSRILRQITDSSNHVRTFHPINPDFSTGTLQLRRIGWREASTFTGFCAKHDSFAFRPLEEAAFVGSPEQCFLVGYRALCHEIHQKSGILKAEATVRSLVDRGLPVESQKALQEMWTGHEEAVRSGLADFQKLKTVMDRQLLSKDYSKWRRAILSFRGDLCVASTGAVSPNRDWDGKPLQVLHDLESNIQQLPFGIVATADGGAAVFVWQAEDTAPQQFIESLLKRDNRRLPSLIVQFIFAYIENTYFSDCWWESLSGVDREHIESLAGIGDAYYTDFSYSFSKLVPWEITSVVVA
jgi:hypothetical protein